jgi:hypothetical protein
MGGAISRRKLSEDERGLMVGSGAAPSIVASLLEDCTSGEFIDLNLMAGKESENFALIYAGHLERSGIEIGNSGAEAYGYEIKGGRMRVYRR